MPSPCRVFNNIDVPVRTASDQPHRLQKFKWRLFYASDIGQPNMEVLPSLDVSFQISSWPSRLQEFLVLMDVINRTSSESFQVHQLSSVANEWEISLLQPLEAIFPSDFLMAGQALSCFFKLMDRQIKVDFILIFRSRNDDTSGINLFSHHTSGCSVASSSPI